MVMMMINFQSSWWSWPSWAGVAPTDSITMLHITSQVEHTCLYADQVNLESYRFPTNGTAPASSPLLALSNHLLWHAWEYNSSTQQPRTHRRFQSFSYVTNMSTRVVECSFAYPFNDLPLQFVGNALTFVDVDTDALAQFYLHRRWVTQLDNYFNDEIYSFIVRSHPIQMDGVMNRGVPWQQDTHLHNKHTNIHISNTCIYCIDCCNDSRKITTAVNWVSRRTEISLTTLLKHEK